MAIPIWLWIATVAGLLALIALDFIVVDRKPHAVTVPEAGKWVVFYVACALAFGVGVWLFSGGDHAVQYLTGYLTEYSLSIDNLFIFLVIMGAFSVPEKYQHRVLLIGIVIALVMRGVFIGVGAALINQFSWVFFIFGAFLLYVAYTQAFGASSEDDSTENFAVRAVRRFFPVTEGYHGKSMSVRVDGKRHLTPMAVVMVSIGGADLMFAVDSIPAIFGITQEPYLVFAANAFALMGLLQLYFLIGGLLDRLVYLSYGIAVILAFIGVKLILHALHEYHLAPDWLDINNIVSLGVIVLVLLVTAGASLWRSRAREHTEVGG